MDQVHTRAMEALQPFVHLANSNSAKSPRFVANLITNATSSPNTYVFAELLETPAIQALRSKDVPEEFHGYLTLLEVFAWGTWQDYQATPNLPSLNDEQTLKLRLLSLLSLSATVKPLAYETLMDSLSISAPADLESLVTTAIYSSLITARLSPTTNPPTVNVTSVAPLRDVKPQSLSTMISVLANWETRCGDVITDIEAEIARIKTNSAKRRAKEREHAELFEKTLSNWPAISADLVGFESGRFTGSKKHGSQGGPRGGSGGGGGPGGYVGSKREFNADDLDDDDGYWENGSEGALESYVTSSRMDIDEGIGSSRAGPGSAATRHAKRVLGKKS
ncbi:hypothetical protein EYZ11_001443 [Aspergillus tanneri]|uniref:PCI domain-containing protein n=1 Tax=Aspergillus tanneri TaxID=1220188 RepID=A0A4S3JUH6_9EURO|nr:uncharacterized protein ATNIH1004_008782 [Aspergillus tanneri]KAA8644577.1 hypothetical protein ATNIH1004_008782 [Aspergillus tanneri]THC99047.1 hypothetical protein EYZ11_001443 [Aspergillus tanneri]